MPTVLTVDYRPLGLPMTMVNDSMLFPMWDMPLVSEAMVLRSLAPMWNRLPLGLAMTWPSVALIRLGTDSFLVVVAVTLVARPCLRTLTSAAMSIPDFGARLE